MNFSFIEVDTRKIDECPTSRGATLRQSAFLPRYDQSNVHEQVRSQLQSMRRSGCQESFDDIPDLVVT